MYDFKGVNSMNNTMFKCLIRTDVQYEGILLAI